MVKPLLQKTFKIIISNRKPSHIKLFIDHLSKSTYRIQDDQVHLQAAIEWLCRAQDIAGSGGVSAGYSLRKGWLPHYPETTGYIISTFLKFASLKDDSRYIAKAIEMGDWEIKVQLPSGAVRGGVGTNDYPMVFNTGQVISGWVSLYKVTKLSRYLEAATKAADWLLSIQDNDGNWSKFTYNDIPHSYYSRVAWPILKLYSINMKNKYKNAAEKKILWVLSNAKGNGWIDYMGFKHNQEPFTHTIAYTLRGLLESSHYLSDDIKQKILTLVSLACENIMRTFELRKKNPLAKPKFLPARFNEKWKPAAKYCCLTGNCQLSIIFLRLYEINNDVRLLNGALKLIDQVKSTQNLDSNNPGIKGGIAGSYPLWGEYMGYTYPNWATKFFADAIMLQESAMKKLEDV